MNSRLDFFVFREKKKAQSKPNLKTVVSGSPNSFEQVSEQHSPVGHMLELEMKTAFFVGV